MNCFGVAESLCREIDTKVIAAKPSLDTATAGFYPLSNTSTNSSQTGWFVDAVEIKNVSILPPKTWPSKQKFPFLRNVETDHAAKLKQYASL